MASALWVQDEDQDDQESSDTVEDMDSDVDMDALIQELENPDGAERREWLNAPTDQEVQSRPAGPAESLLTVINSQWCY